MTTEATDADLAARARSGDDRAFGMLVERHQTVAFRTAYVICGSAADAEDAAQDAFIKARGAIGRFRAGAPFRPWLLTIVANEARNRRRSAAARHGQVAAVAGARERDGRGGHEQQRGEHGGQRAAGAAPEAAGLARRAGDGRRQVGRGGPGDLFGEGAQLCFEVRHATPPAPAVGARAPATAAT